MCVCVRADCQRQCTTAPLVCPPLPISCIYQATVVTRSHTHSDSQTYTELKHLHSLCYSLRPPLSLSPSLFFPSSARSHQRIGLDYNLICSGRDGIEHQIIHNEENQSPRVQISRKLVNSDWFRHSSRQGGIWQITASQVDREKGGEQRERERRGEERLRKMMNRK